MGEGGEGEEGGYYAGEESSMSNRWREFRAQHRVVDIESRLADTLIPKSDSERVFLDVLISACFIALAYWLLWSVKLEAVASCTHTEDLSLNGEGDGKGGKRRDSNSEYGS